RVFDERSLRLRDGRGLRRSDERARVRSALAGVHAGVPRGGRERVSERAGVHGVRGARYRNVQDGRGGGVGAGSRGGRERERARGGDGEGGGAGAGGGGGAGGGRRGGRMGGRRGGGGGWGRRRGRGPR